MKRGHGMMGIVLVSLLLSSTAAPAVLAESVSAEPPPPANEEEKGLIEGVLEDLFLRAPGIEKTGYPYDQVKACLNFCIPPLEPLLITIPPFLNQIIPLLHAVLEDPAVVTNVLALAIKLILSNPASVVSLIELILSPYTLSTLLNPVECLRDPNVKAILGGINWTKPQTCLESCASGLGSWITGLAIVNLLPYVLNIAKTEFEQ